MRRRPSSCGDGVDDPTIDQGLRTRMAKGFERRVGVRGHARSRAGLDLAKQRRSNVKAMEFGLFNSACVLPQFDGDEHRRIMDEVAIVQRRRPGRVQVHVGDRAPLPHRVLAPLGQRGVPRLPRGRDRTHPPRLGHLQHHAAGEPPGARRRAGRDARPPLAKDASSSAWAAVRRPPSSAASVSPNPI